MFDCHMTKCFRSRALILIWALVSCGCVYGATAQRENLTKAILSDDLSEQTQLLQKLIGVDDPIIQQTLIAWRGGEVYLYETNDTRVPFLLDPQTDTDGKAKGIRIIDGEFLKGTDGKPLLFTATELTAADATSKLRKAIKIPNCGRPSKQLSTCSHWVM
jgi:hypothetical protein